MRPGPETSAEQDAWTTSRLRARPPATADAADVLALHRDPRAVLHNPGDALADLPAAQQLVHRWVQQWRDRGIGYWVLSGREDDVFLGVCGVKHVVLDDRPVLNLLYRLHPGVWGRGLASEAATAVVARARRHPSRLPVVARVRPANRASARVALAAGLQRAPHLDTCGEDGREEVYVVGPG